MHSSLHERDKNHQRCLIKRNPILPKYISDIVDQNLCLAQGRDRLTSLMRVEVSEVRRPPEPFLGYMVRNR